MGGADLETAVAEFAAKVPTLVVTRSEQGALAVRGGQRVDVPAEPIERLVDTTGAGDLFASGFLAGVARGLDLETSLRLGAIAAALNARNLPGVRFDSTSKAVEAGFEYGGTTIPVLRAHVTDAIAV